MAAENDVTSEIEVLQSIYLDELQVTQEKDGGWEVSLVLYPSTAEDVDSQFVRLTLTLSLPPQYPSSPPVISIHNPRGLSDDKLLSVQRCLQREAESCPGGEVLYQVIEKAKEILTESNIPHGSCVICLYGFKDGEAFTKTSCYHHFHSHCLGRYMRHSEEELREREREIEEDKSRGMIEGEELSVVCPVCREPLACDVESLLSTPAPEPPEVADELVGAEFRQKWVQLQKILERQREQGGIIDPEVESNRFLIHINEGPAESSYPSCSATSDLSPSPMDSHPSVIQQSSPQAPPPNQGKGRGYPGRRGRGHNRGGRRGRGGAGSTRVLDVRIPEAVQDFSKLSLAMRDQAEGDAGALTETGVDLGPRSDTTSEDVTSSEGSCKGQQPTEAVTHPTTDQAPPSNQHAADEPKALGGQGSSSERPPRRGHWQHGRRRVPQYPGQETGQWQERNSQEAEQRHPPRGGYHHRGYRGRGRGGSGGQQSRGGGGGGGFRGRGQHREAHREPLQPRAEVGVDRPVL